MLRLLVLALAFVCTAGISAGAQLPVSVEPPPPPPDLIMPAVWVEQPTPAQVARAYPERARADQLGGSVNLECRVADHGQLSCRGASARTELVAAGFIQAAQSLVPYYRIADTDAHGVSTAGRPVNLRIEIAPLSSIIVMNGAEPALTELNMASCATPNARRNLLRPGQTVATGASRVFEVAPGCWIMSLQDGAASARLNVTADDIEHYTLMEQ